MYPDNRKRAKKAVSLMAALAVLASAVGTAAAVSIRSDSQLIAAAQSEPSAPDSQPATMTSEPASPSAIAAAEPMREPDAGTGLDANARNAVPLSDDSAAPEEAAAYGRAAGVPTAQDVYNAMNALKEKYPEGMTWTNFEPYGSKGSLGTAYTWKGGAIDNANSGVGCAAFAFLLSDAAFGDLPARKLSVRFENVNAGDILRVNNNSHSVIILQKSAAGVIIAEGNYNKTVHWGRVMSKAEVEAANFMITRYPEGSAPSDHPGEGESVIYSGSEDGLNWALTNTGTLTVSGGAIKNYSPNDSILPPWNEHSASISTVVIEDGVTSIGDYAFYQSKALSVYIPDGVTTIGQSAFYGSKLLSVTIPGTVKTIGHNAFQNCESLISVTVSEGVKTIEDNAFRGCTALQYIDFPASITKAGAGAFMDCAKMTRVRFKPGSETVAIGDNLFTRCRNLTDVTLPEKADCISAGMFLDCLSLPKLYIPAGITEIKGLGEASGSPFSGCSALTEINFAGDESTWNAIGGKSAMTYSGLSSTIVNFNVPFPDPFIEDPSDHAHNWLSADWNHDESYHWHECSTANCPVANNSEKDGYAAHSYGSWVTDVSATSYQSGSRHRDCTVCAYRQTDSIPATGSNSSSGSGSYGGSGSSGGSWSSGSSGSYGGSWGSGSYGGSSGSSNNSSSPANPAAPDSSDSSTDETDQSPGSTDSNTADNSSSNANGSSEPDSANGSDSSDTANSSSSNLKQLKTKFNKQLKTSLKSQLKSQLKTKLKKKLKATSKQPSKAKLKKQLKAALKQQLKTKLKKQLKKQYGTQLGDQFVEQFNKQFNALFNEIYNEQFQTLYKQLSTAQKKS